MPRLITGIWHITPIKVNSSDIYIQGQNSSLSLLATSVTYILHRGNTCLSWASSQIFLYTYEYSLPKKQTKKKVVSTKSYLLSIVLTKEN